MVCVDCEKFQTSVICPEPWKAGSNNSVTGAAGRKLGDNKLLSKNARASRGGNILSNKCKLCKQRVNDPHGTYCQRCAFSKGVCHICGVETLAGKEFYRSDYSEEMEKRYAPKRSSTAAMPSEGVVAADLEAMKAIKKKKRKKQMEDEEEVEGDTKAYPVAVVAPVPAGFEPDPHTGFYHNAKTGQYYDSKSKIYCCHNEGQWYYYDNTAQEYKPWIQANTGANAEAAAQAAAEPVETAIEAAPEAPEEEPEIDSPRVEREEDEDDEVQEMEEPVPLPTQNDDGFTFIAFGE
eukprot:TRINITY_DN1965_c0_g1_i2.p1 TRINITY_DN1965_c0_g1~~TRINITY_DN1965_c0_g1_i2.p1  ORF type:complete len:292 (-),score=71.61 TRINITY_DN1965_c0_g1_i2:114-989(-)